jgi:hypothetical protein
VLVLRTMGKSHDEASSMIKCAKEKVGKAERWFMGLPLNEAVRVCDNEAVKRLVIRKFPEMDETSPSDLVLAGQLTGEDILRYYRPDHMYPRVGFEEKQKFLELLGHWRQQLEFPSIGSFLNEARLLNLDDKLESEVVETLEVSQSYTAASARHWRTMSKSLKPVLSVENEPLFKQLQSRFPNSKAWLAQANWDKAFKKCLDTFTSAVSKIEVLTELDISSRLKGFPGEPVDIKVSETRELLQELKESNPALWKNLQLLKIVFDCDVFMLGISEQLPAAFWTVDLENLRKIRSEVDRRRMLRSTDYDPWASRRSVDNMARYLWGHDDIRDKVSALLGAFAALKAAQGPVYLSLDALERDISGSAGFSEPVGDAT